MTDITPSSRSVPQSYEIVKQKTEYAEAHGLPSTLPIRKRQKEEPQDVEIQKRKPYQVRPGLWIMPREDRDTRQISIFEEGTVDSDLYREYGPGTHSMTPRKGASDMIAEDPSPVEQVNTALRSRIEGIIPPKYDPYLQIGIHMGEPGRLAGPFGPYMMGWVSGVREEPVKTIAVGAAMAALGAAGPTAEAVGVTGFMARSAAGRAALDLVPTAVKVGFGVAWGQSAIERVSGGALPGSLSFNETGGLGYRANISALPPPERMVRTMGEITGTEIVPAMIGYSAGQWIGQRAGPSLAVIQKIASSPVEQAAPIRSTARLFQDLKGIESSYRMEPDLALVKNIPEGRVGAITEYISGRPHAIFGRSTEIGQMPREMFLARGGTKDIDVFMGNPSRAAIEASRVLEGQAIGNLVKTTGTAMDIHAFPKGYPIGKSLVEPSYDIMQPAFDPLPKTRADLLFGKGIVQEKLYIQAGRKAVSVFGERGQPFGPESHRMKDVLDLVRYSDYLAGELQTSIPKMSSVDIPGRILTQAKVNRIIASATTVKTYFGDPANVGGYIEGTSWAQQIRDVPLREPKGILSAIGLQTRYVPIPEGMRYDIPTGKMVSIAPRVSVPRVPSGGEPSIRPSYGYRHPLEGAGGIPPVFIPSVPSLSPRSASPSGRSVTSPVPRIPPVLSAISPSLGGRKGTAPSYPSVPSPSLPKSVVPSLPKVPSSPSFVPKIPRSPSIPPGPPSRSPVPYIPKSPSPPYVPYSYSPSPSPSVSTHIPVFGVTIPLVLKDEPMEFRTLGKVKIREWRHWNPVPNLGYVTGYRNVNIPPLAFPTVSLPGILGGSGGGTRKRRKK